MKRKKRPCTVLWINGIIFGIDMFNFIQRLRRKWVEPAIYAVVVKDNSEGNTISCFFVKVLVAHSYDEAVEQMQEHAKKHVCNKAEHKWSIFIWEKMDMETLFKDVAIGELIEDKKDVSKKNALMKKIIDEKNVSLYEKNRPRFNAAEAKLIETELSRFQ